MFTFTCIWLPCEEKVMVITVAYVTRTHSLDYSQQNRPNEQRLF